MILDRAAVTDLDVVVDDHVRTEADALADPDAFPEHEARARRFAHRRPRATSARQASTGNASTEPVR